MFDRRIRGLVLAAGIVALLTGAVGCIFSPDDTGDGGGNVITEDYVFPDTPDKLMENFVTAYTVMNKEKFEEMLHPEYEFLQEIDDAAITQDWYRSDELIFLGNLFLGEPFVNLQGTTVDPVNSITLTLDGSAGPWVNSDHQNFESTTENPCWKRQYAVIFDVSQPDRVLEVRNAATFFVTRRDSLVEGTNKWYYQIRGQLE